MNPMSLLGDVFLVELALGYLVAKHGGWWAWGVALALWMSAAGNAVAVTIERIGRVW